MEASELAGPLGEIEEAMQGWALGTGWPQKRIDWRRRLDRIKRHESLDPEAEVSALLRRLLHAAQPAFDAAGGNSALPSVGGGAGAGGGSSEVMSVSATPIDGASHPDDGPALEVLPTTAVSLHRMPTHHGASGWVS